MTCGFCFAAAVASLVTSIAALFYCARERRQLLRALLEGRVDEDHEPAKAAKTAQAKALERWRGGEDE